MARRSDKEIFVDVLKQQHGNRAGNTLLQRELGWEETKYWKVHEQLFKDGQIEKGKGYGGTVILTQKEVTLPTVAAEPLKNFPAAAIELAKEYTSEIQLYPSVKKELQAHWANRRQLDDCHCEITALQGRRDTGGSWSRPDLVIVAVRKYEFLPERVFELFSFEVKPDNDVTIKGVLEALAHREAATRSFVIYHTNGKDFSDFPEAERIEEVAARHGVGVFAAKDINDFNLWAEIVTAPRMIPDPETIDTFIRRTLSEEGKTKLRRWF